MGITSRNELLLPLPREKDSCRISQSLNECIVGGAGTIYISNIAQGQGEAHNRSSSTLIYLDWELDFIPDHDKIDIELIKNINATKVKIEIEVQDR